MSEINEIFIDKKYIVRDKSSSDGSQPKYHYDRKWYKVDHYGGEGEVEYLASLLLMCTNLESDKYVVYDKVIINGQMGCVSAEFRNNPQDEEFITFYRLYKNLYGRDLLAVTSKMDYDDAIMYVINFMKREIGIDVTEYLANIFWLDYIILNTDRHFNNLGIIMTGDGYKLAPIFDNGKSLSVGTGCNELGFFKQKQNRIYAKAFSPDFYLNKMFLNEYCSIKLDVDKLINRLSFCSRSIYKDILTDRLHKLI